MEYLKKDEQRQVDKYVVRNTRNMALVSSHMKIFYGKHLNTSLSHCMREILNEEWVIRQTVLDVSTRFLIL